MAKCTRYMQLHEELDDDVPDAAFREEKENFEGHEIIDNELQHIDEQILATLEAEDEEDMQDEEAEEDADDDEDSMLENFRNAIVNRKETIEKLKEHSKNVADSYLKSREAKIGATSATITGSVIELGGFFASFFTAGISFPIAIAGGVVGGAGAMTLAGAELGYIGVSEIKYKDTKRLIKKDIQIVKKIGKKHGRKIYQHLESCFDNQKISINTFTGEKKQSKMEVVVEKTSDYSKPAIQAGKIAMGAGKVGLKAVQTTYNAGRIVAEPAFDAVELGFKPLRFVRPALTGSRLTLSGLRTSAAAIPIAGAILNIVFIPMDIGVLSKAAFDVHSQKKKGNCRSNVANKIDKFILALEENLTEMERTLQQLESDYN